MKLYELGQIDHDVIMKPPAPKTATFATITDSLPKRQSPALVTISKMKNAVAKQAAKRFTKAVGLTGE